MSDAMSPDEFRRLLASADYSQHRFAAMVGVDGRTGQKWALGETRIPGAVALILRLLEARPELKEVIEKMTPPAPRARSQRAKGTGRTKKGKGA